MLRLVSAFRDKLERCHSTQGVLDLDLDLDLDSDLDLDLDPNYITRPSHFGSYNYKQSKFRGTRRKFRYSAVKVQST